MAPGQRFPHFFTKDSACRASRVEARRVHDEVEVGHDVIVRVLGHLAQDVPELVDRAALDLRRPPRERDCPVQARVAVDDAQAWRLPAIPRPAI